MNLHHQQKEIFFLFFGGWGGWGVLFSFGGSFSSKLVRALGVENRFAAEVPYFLLQVEGLKALFWTIWDAFQQCCLDDIANNFFFPF